MAVGTWTGACCAALRDFPTFLRIITHVRERRDEIFVVVVVECTVFHPTQWRRRSYGDAP